MGRFSKNKGKIGEREVLGLIRARMHNAETRLGYKHESARLKRTSGMAAADGGDDIVGMPLYSVEVKNCRDLRIAQWWLQACKQADTSRLSALLVYKVPRKGWRAMFVYQGAPVDWTLDRFLTELYMPWYEGTYLPMHGTRV